nr:hypothetical protein [Saccharothrix espanaensis]
MSRTAMSCTVACGGTSRTSARSPSTPIPGLAWFSMNITGRSTVVGRPSPRRCCSMRHLVLQCEIPASRSAPPTEVWTRRPTPAAAAASATATPIATSGTSGVAAGCTLNTPCAPATARSSEPRSRMSPATSSAPAAAGSRALGAPRLGPAPGR